MFYKVRAAEGYEWINAIDAEDYETLMFRPEKLAGKRWNPVKVRRVTTDMGREFKPSDFPWLGSALIMRQRAADELRDLWDANGELLPLESEDDVQLHVFNCRIVDALDEARSSVMRFPSTNRIMYIEKPVFREGMVAGIDLFRLPLHSATYVGETFLQRYTKAGLTGLSFQSTDTVVSLRSALGLDARRAGSKRAD